MDEIKVGDRVIVTADYAGLTTWGETGTVDKVYGDGWLAVALESEPSVAYDVKVTDVQVTRLCDANWIPLDLDDAIARI